MRDRNPCSKAAFVPFLEQLKTLDKGNTHTIMVFVNNTILLGGGKSLWS
jgi:hypothetical protein